MSTDFNSPVQMSKSQNSSCFLEPLTTGGGYLSCDVKRSRIPGTFVPLDIVRGSRPEYCENPQFANAFPMRFCAYKYHDLRRCGCPALDPNKNPKLWNAYVESVKDAVSSKLDQDEITLAIFASGYLLQDCELLDQLFRDERFNHWQGTLNLQFIDLNYKLSEIEKVQGDIKNTSSLEKVDWRLMVPAIVLGACGGASTIYAAQSSNEKARKTAYVAGIILIVSAIILGCVAFNSQSGETQEIRLNDSIMDTLDQFLQVIEQQAPFSIHVDFFPNAEACIGKSNKSDVIIGYDIDNTLEIFEGLKMKNLKDNGEVILVTKEMRPNEGLIKVMRRAVGAGVYIEDHFD